MYFSQREKRDKKNAKRPLPKDLNRTKLNDNVLFFTFYGAINYFSYRIHLYAPYL